MEDLQKIYAERAEKYAAAAQASEARYIRFSLLRLLSFIGGTAAVILLFASVHWAAGVVGLAAFLLLFSRFITWHGRVKTAAELQKNLTIINQRELTALRDGDFSAFADGAHFKDPTHPYTTDLDIFGAHGFFQYVNRTASAVGAARLADYLRFSADPEEIKHRQAAVKELRDLTDWRQTLQAVGLATKDDISHVRELDKWLAEEPYISDNSLYRTLIILAPVFTLAALVLWVVYLPWYAALLFFLPAGYALKQTAERIGQTHYYTNRAEKILTGYAAMIKQAEDQKFTSEKLLTLSAVFSLEHQKASEQIERLSYIIGQLNLRNNFFAIFFNFVVLWDLKQVKALEKWRAERRDLLPRWFAALAELEALNSLATAYYNNPDWTFPAVGTETVVRAEAIGHPLIPAEKRITNDIEIPTRGHLKLITGSNMAGKSTFMRTVGLNIVLAQIGAPVCAEHLSLPPLKVYTSMRTEDALHESTSSFYAELKRLKFIIEAVEKGENIFFLLDEILKGTNSRDRHTGSKALIKQLIEAKGSGMIATHDLDLGGLEKEYGGAVENLRIEVEIRDKELFFDYKIKPGVSESFNATILMQQMGIKM